MLTIFFILVKELKKQQSQNVSEDDAALLIQKGKESYYCP